MEEINLKVKAIFYDYSQGGRINPVRENYRTSILFGLTENQHNRLGKLPFEDIDFSLNSSGKFISFSETPDFNKELEGILRFKNYYPKINDYLNANEHFIIFEGERIVGKGTVVEKQKPFLLES